MRSKTIRNQGWICTRGNWKFKLQASQLSRKVISRSYIRERYRVVKIIKVKFYRSQIFKIKHSNVLIFTRNWNIICRTEFYNQTILKIFRIKSFILQMSILLLPWIFLAWLHSRHRSAKNYLRTNWGKMIVSICTLRRCRGRASAYTCTRAFANLTKALKLRARRIGALKSV